MNSQNPNLEKNDHKTSEKDDGPQTLALLQKIKDRQISPKSIGKANRLLLVSFLTNEGQTTAEIAHLLKVTIKTIQRDIKVLHEENAITKDPKLIGQMVGRLVSEAELCKQRIRKFQRERDASPADKMEGEQLCFQIICRLTERLQSLGYLPTAAQKVSAELTYQIEEVLTLEQIDKEVKRLKQIEGNPSEKEKTENEIIAQFEDESNKEKGNQNEQA